MNIATFQMPFPSAKWQDNLERIRQKLHTPLARAADLVVFPECYLTGYFTQSETARAVALELNGQVFDAVLAALQGFQNMIVLGMIEVEEGNLYNTAVVIASGQLLGKYRKTHPNEGCFVAGLEYPVFAVTGQVFGINICFDANFPEAAQHIASQGAKLIVYPLNNALPVNIADRWREKSPENLRLRAVETGCYVVSSDVCGVTENQISYGCTQIFSPDGQILAAVSEMSEGVAVWDI
jgi:5-aminopentanamidase